MRRLNPAVPSDAVTHRLGPRSGDQPGLREDPRSVVAKTRGITLAQVDSLVRTSESRDLGFMGEPRVNVPAAEPGVDEGLSGQRSSQREGGGVVSERGKLREYLGAAPGVGKTYAHAR